MKLIINHFLLAIFFVVLGIPAFATMPSDSYVIPMDSAIRYGVLPNGLTYYIKHNNEPKNRADFYIAQKVGSILENEDQRGLAHFLEHMAFNGTTHFPGKKMLEYLQDNGLRFGADINASTGFDQTVYFIANVPTTNSNLMDSVSLALYDWGNEISLENGEIEKERGVINEEWRTRGDAQMRMYEAVLPTFYKGSKYANRLPIGLMEVVMNFKPETLRKYYDTWYRPDQQGIIIVGDFDAAQMEKKIVALFNNSTMPKDVKEREYFPVPNNVEPIYALYKDKEASYTTIQVFFKHDTYPKEGLNTLAKYKYDVTNVLAQLLFSMRYSEIAQKPDSPFNGAYAYDGDFFISPTKSAYTFMARAKEGQSLNAFNGLLTEARRVGQHGFSQSELDRAKSQIMVYVKNQYLEKDKQQNRKLANEYVSNFTEGGYLPNPELDYKLASEIVPTITLADVNKFVATNIHHDNVVIGIFGSDKEGIEYPSEAQIVESFNKIMSEDTKNYEDKALNVPLISKVPKAGKIISEKSDAKTGITTMKLSNGATVYLKPTDFKNDEISMTAFSIGGNWAYGGKNTTVLKMVDKIVDISSMGAYNKINLNKYLAGKMVGINFELNDPSEEISGSSSKKDLETLFQLNYLYFTDVRKDEQAFQALKSRMKSDLSLRKNSPRAIFIDSIKSTTYSHNPLYTSLTEGEVDQVSYDAALAILKERTANAGDYTFSFVGSFNIDSIKPYIVKYIASLPDNGKREKISYNVGVTSGLFNNHFERQMENPKTSCYTVISGKLPYSTKNRMLLNMLNGVMRINYTNTIREEEGGTYGVSTSTSLNKYNDQWSFSYNFDTNREVYKKLNDRALSEFYNMLLKGADESTFNKVKEATIKQYEINLRNNGYWMSVLTNKAIGIDSYTGYEDMLKAVTLADFNKFIKTLYNKDNNLSVVMEGVPATK